MTIATISLTFSRSKKAQSVYGLAETIDTKIYEIATHRQVIVSPSSGFRATGSNACVFFACIRS